MLNPFRRQQLQNLPPFAGGTVSYIPPEVLMAPTMQDPAPVQQKEMRAAGIPVNFADLMPQPEAPDPGELAMQEMATSNLFPQGGSAGYSAPGAGAAGGSYIDPNTGKPYTRIQPWMMTSQREPIAATTNDQIGMLQEPAIQNQMRNLLLQSLAGAAQAGQNQSRDLAQQSRDIDREGVDRFNANILYPLTGFIPGNQKTALDASADLLRQIEARKKDRSSAQRNQLEIFNNLGKFARDADPSDWENALKREQETRLQDNAASVQRSREATIKNNEENLALNKQKLTQREKENTARAEQWKNANGLKRDKLESEIANSKITHEIQQKRLEQQLMLANTIEDRHDRQMAITTVQREMDALDNERKVDETLALKIEELKLQASAVNKDGLPTHGTAGPDGTIIPLVAPTLAGIKASVPQRAPLRTLPALQERMSAYQAEAARRAKLKK